MRKAFLFTVIFVLLFTVFLLLSIFHLRMLQMSELSLAQTENTTRVIYVLDDVKSDILNFLELSLSIESNSTHTVLNISDVLPSHYTNPVGSLREYKSFINGTYSNQTNLLNPATNQSVISLNTTSFENSPSIRFINSNSSLNLRYGYNNLSKIELIISDSKLVREYSIKMKLNRTCLNGNCANATLAGGPPRVDSSTMGLWHFDEGSGMIVYDGSGNGNNGALSSSNIDWVGGVFRQALRFDRSTGTEHVTVSDSNTLDINGSFTVEMWFKPFGTGLLGWLLNKGNSSNYGSTNYQVWIDGTSNKIRVSIGNGTAEQNLTSINAIQTDRWYHIAFTGDGATLKLYVNGVLDNSTSQTLTPASNNGALVIGARTTSDALFRFNGTIDEVAVYSRAKSAEEIASDANLFHWDWGSIAINNNVSAAWRFDEGGGNVSHDTSGNGNVILFNGTITAVLAPSNTNKAYQVNHTSADNPFLATAEMNYSKINASDNVQEVSVASYSNTFTMACSPSGTCSCIGSSFHCWSLDVCVNYAGCSYSCPTAPAHSVSTGNTCSVVVDGCHQTCVSCSE